MLYNTHMTSKEILTKYIEFFQARGHKLIPNVSLVPEGDSTLLFVNSGMFPLVPYLSGQKHPLGKRLVNVQRALRFQDMEEVGDNRHTTAFHMIGNWSLGDYFKNEQLPWMYELLVDELGLDPKRLYSTVFAGDESAPKDTESVELLKQVFAKHGIDAKEGEKIFAYGKKSNWWQRGEAVGELGGPDSEVYFYMKGVAPVGQGPEDDEEVFFEICNSVFMQYHKTEKGWEPLPQSNVDFGGGLERIAVAVQGKNDIYETDNFWPLVEKIQEISGKDYYADPRTTKNMRIVADHMRASTFLAMDGVTPSNKDQGYILRRLLRRMIRAGRGLGVEKDISVRLVSTIVGMFDWMYPQLKERAKEIETVFASEEKKFFDVLKRGSSFVEKTITEIEKLNSQDLAQKSFDLFQSVGYPSEIFIEEIKDHGIKVDEAAFKKSYDEIYDKHQEVSRAGLEKKFKGGLADTSEINIRYHTATHLLQRALKNVLGESVVQLGSNITSERLRFDFPYKQKLTDDEIKAVEKIMNDAVDAAMPVTYVMLPKEEAISKGAVYMKNESYPETVKVYYIGSTIEDAFSKEFCGGPHVENTSVIGHLEIFKQENIGDGKMRVYARFANVK
jgi:alanyl-tRNA synthetase